MRLPHIPKMLIASFIAILTSCSSSDEPQDAVAPKHQIIVLYAPGRLGDMGYNDAILRGVQSFKKSHYADAEFYQYSPSDTEQAERVLTDWLSLPESNVPALFVAASSDYEAIVNKCVSQRPLTANKRLLLFESDMEKEQVTTFRISMYGASYLAGVSAAICSDGKPLVVLGNGNDSAIASASEGFIAGFNSAIPDVAVDVTSLADDWHGYVSANKAYEMMTTWAPQYGFIFPIAGGSNSGIYRYSRENPNSSPLLAGMDVDQSALSANITGSVVKHIDRLIYEYLDNWMNTGELLPSGIYGIESGYVDWVLSDFFAPRLHPPVDRARSEAITKENQSYEKNN